ncbi:coiled-coil domain-containing protein 146-like [Rhopilema esculentum]|uniref:coiled-coil domain-containing protein 146-like n=1 Tax=Rhopilema esculentum TaxID=499914 RepID=UPI0031D89E32
MDTGQQPNLYAVREEDDGDNENVDDTEKDNKEALSSSSPEEDIVLYPMAPRTQSQADNQVDVKISPAYQILDQLFSSGEISGEKAARLKAKYQDLVEFLKTTRETEASLLYNAKSLIQEVQRQRLELEKGEAFPDVEDNEVKRLRSDWLKHSNEISASEDRLSQLNFKLDGLREEKRLLLREYDRMPKKEEIDKQLQELETNSEELKIEIAQRIHEGNNLKEELTSRDQQIESLSKKIEKKEAEEQNLKDQLLKIHSEPAHLSKQSDLITRQQRDFQEKKDTIKEQIEEFNKEVKKVAERKTLHLEEKSQLTRALDEQRSIFEDKEREVDFLMKECDLAKEKQAELLGDRTTLDLNLKHSLLEKKNEHDVHARKQREKDRNLKILKKGELQLKAAQDSLAHVKSIHDKVAGQVEALPKDDGSLLEKRKELQKEVDIARRNLALKNAATARERHNVEEGKQKEEQLLAEQGQLRVDVVDLTRLAQIKADEREQKARDYLKAELRYQRALEDLKTKELTIQDSAKKHTEVQHRLQEFAKLYDVIKNERNKCVNQIQTSTQQAAEMREKIKILQNEIEILRTAAAARERHLQKAKLKHGSAVIIRDSLRNEVSKQQMNAEELKEKREQQRLAIAKLNDMISKAEENMVELRRQYEAAVQERNSRGIHLIERNEEVCVFYEKVNVQESMIRNGEMELKNREEEIRFLKMESADLRRSNNLMKRALPQKRSLDDELVTLQLQLLECQEYLLDLEKSLENPSQSDRVRLLGGKDPSQDELLKKTAELEKRLAEKEEQMLEKELILEEVTRLLDRTKHKTETGKEDTLKIAKKVNELQAKIKDMTRKMMAMVSELSMNQAKAMKLQQELKGKEAHLEQCYLRMERGEPPNEEIEIEWQKILRQELLRRNEMEQRKAAEEEIELYTIPGGITTTAEPRPNAYIPDDESELPVPRPYGAHAPFKPTEPGSNLRHIRKPIIKPIEL